MPRREKTSAATAPPTATTGCYDRTIFDSLSAHIAILDKNGVILDTNRAWSVFGKANAVDIDPAMIQLNYLKVCDSAAADREFGQVSQRAARGIRAVIDGKFEEFAMDYPCHSPTEKLWFYMRATRIDGPGPYRVVISHENITPLKQAEETIKEHEKDLELKTQSLEEANTALKVLLKQREEDKRDLEEKVVANVRQLVTPYLEKIAATRLDARQKAFLDIISGHLNDIISPFLHRLSAMHLHLTPQEIQVATLVKAGRTTKEISDILGISTNAVDFHRKNIRRKFGLKNQQTNLRSFLMSLS